MDFDDGTLRGIVDERRTEEQLRFAFRSKFTHNGPYRVATVQVAKLPCDARRAGEYLLGSGEPTTATMHRLSIACRSPCIRCTLGCLTDNVPVAP